MRFSEGAFLVQAGDLLARWTSYAIRPNIHRVVNPPAEVAARSRRISIPYFHYPRLDLLVEAAPSCLAPGRRPSRPVIAGEHAFSRQEDYKGDDDAGVEDALQVVLLNLAGVKRPPVMLVLTVMPPSTAELDAEVDPV